MGKKIVHNTITSELDLAQALMLPASERRTKVTSLSTSKTFVAVIFNAIIKAGLLMATEFARPSIASASGPRALQPR